jgi:hypoxanthine phosphoribosyltransferase
VTPLIEEPALAERVAAMASAIASECAGVDELVVVGVLRGAFVFMADLVRELSRQGVSQVPGFIRVASCGAGTRSAGTVTPKQDLDLEVKNRTPLLVDDIPDSGRTLDFAARILRDRGATRVITAVLLDEAGRRELPVEADLVEFEAPDRFVVG